ncbi:putative Cytochrome P450 [Seiridium cardinale]|uniref:Cytochrome P450 n=1 Tax=Seiridium cardinale TaxID=138064 RepID=A0ABR2Y4E4_9PEZI
MVSNPVLLAIAGFITWYVVSSVLTWYRLRHIPGPKLGSFSYLWVAQKVFRGKGLDYEHLKKYGSLVRVGPNYVLMDDPEDIRRINGARNSSRDEWYLGSKLDPNQDWILSILDGDPHDALKAKISFAYSGRDGIDFGTGVDGQITHLIDVLRERFISKGGNGRTIDFAHFIRYFTLDTITTIGYGKAFGFMDAEGDLYNYTREIENILGLIATAGDVPVLRRIFISPLVSRLFAPKATDPQGIGKVIGVAHKIVEDRMEKDNEKTPDMITSFKRRGLSVEEIKMETFVQITAGSDTTAVAIRSTMLYLMTCPRAYLRLKTEIKEAIASGVSRPITNDQAKKLPYLQAVIWEGLRMRSPTTYGFYKKIPSKGETIQGKFIPGGTAVGFNLPAVMRLEKVFGQDAQLFRPERFLECDEEKKMDMIRTVDLVFGYGRWMCAGKTLAMVELNKIYFELLREFEWQLVYPGNAWIEKAYTAVMQRNMWVSITEADTA